MRQTATQGALGMLASAVLPWWFTISGLETGIRIAGELTSLLIGLATLVVMVRKGRAGKNE